MWIFLSDSFLSIVADADPALLVVRARRKGDIERVFPRLRAIRTLNRDYLYRRAIPRGLVEEAIAGAVAGIEYRNFKDSVKDNVRHAAYVSVWQTMHSYQARAAHGHRLPQARLPYEAR